MKYFTRLTSTASVRGLLCLDIQIKNFGGELLLYLEEDYIHLKKWCEEILGKRKVYLEKSSVPPTEHTEIKINSLFLSRDKIVELDEPWVSLRVKCLRKQLPHIIDLHETWWKILLIGAKNNGLVKESMNEHNESYKHFRTIKKFVQYTRREEDFELDKVENGKYHYKPKKNTIHRDKLILDDKIENYILKLYDYILDNEQEVLTELNSRWLISITETLCRLKDDGHQFVLLHSLMRMIQVYNSKLFMVGFFNRINQKGDIVQMDDLNGSDFAKYIPAGGWSEMWDELQARFENDYVFETVGKNIDGVMTNKICKVIFREFINRIHSTVMKEDAKRWLLNDNKENI